MNGHPYPVLYPMDLPLKAGVARLTHGISPAALSLAFQDWWVHIVTSPGKQAELAASAQRMAAQWLLDVQACVRGDGAALAESLAADKRFARPEWCQPPFDMIAGAFLVAQRWWSEATNGVPGVSAHHGQVASFMARQLLDTASPSNFVPTNPELLEATIRQGGANLLDGWMNWARDALLVAANRPPSGAEHFRPGEAVALTPGKVVWRNRLAELIQYAPSTAKVHREPVLIVPSWIMKYYILDLSAHNSLVRWLVGQGHTVFMVSWKNPLADDRDLGMDDYVDLGVLEPLQVLQRALPGRGIHLVGYCLGGTLAAIASAHLVQRGRSALKTLSLLAAQADFEEPGELGLFIDESQVAFLEDSMAEQGFLDGRQMAGAFALINSKDLVWSKLVREYLLGNVTPLDDLHAWNADATRMPARMHGEYLRRLYLNNDLAEGRYEVHGRPVVLEDLRLPMFVVGTERDHVSPWRSVYKIHRLANGEITFALTTGGHNVGIVNPPRDDAAALGISHRIGTRRPGATHEDADSWAAAAERRPGSWWPSWQAWLAAHSGPLQAPPPIGGSGRQALKALDDAPGRYVHGS
ncbi:MAG TPA: alpha/beta fold hydrolase [Burkholderiaceae bacterium]